MHIRQRISGFLANLTRSLFPHLEAVLPSQLTEEHRRVAVILEVIRVEEQIPWPVTSPRGGRPPLDRRKLARAYIVRTALGISETEDLVYRLQADRTLRRLCGWQEGERLPSLATFSRAFADYARSGLFDQVHAELVTEHLSDTVTEHVSYDTTAIPVRERAVKTAKPARVARKRGRPRRGEERPAPEPTRLQRQQTQAVAEMLAELPTDCSVGCKKNSQGNKEYWTGYKLHVAQTDDGLPVAAFTTGASMHDSGGAIPLLQLTQQRVRSCYDLMDSAYDAKEISAVSEGMGHVPIIDANARRTGTKAEREALAKLPFSSLDVERALIDTDRRRHFNARSSVERFNGRLKDNTGVRMIRVRGQPKVHALLMCGLLVIFAEALLALGR
jgi:hypothetical protein